MGEAPDTILDIGCPSSDIARTVKPKLPSDIINSSGSGATLDGSEPYLLVIFHPTTTEFGLEKAEMYELLNALDHIKMQTILLWPNIDAGADRISKAIRVFRDHKAPTWLRTLTNLEPDTYLHVLGGAACAIGNSSSFVRDASFFGTPIVLVGERQEGRETGEHVVHCAPISSFLVEAITNQLAHGRYDPSTLYGDGHTADRIASALARLTPYVQKRLHYIHDAAAERPLASYAPAAAPPAGSPIPATV
jgi:UDP-N-acetylglucosamine 2-epimerase